MEAVGQLAGGMAHDFNNLLTAIMGYCELSLRGLPATIHEATTSNRSQEAAERAASLTRQLLAFSRKQVIAAEGASTQIVVVAIGGDAAGDCSASTSW